MPLTYLEKCLVYLLYFSLNQPKTYHPVCNTCLILFYLTKCSLKIIVESWYIYIYTYILELYGFLQSVRCYIYILTEMTTKLKNFGKVLVFHSILLQVSINDCMIEALDKNHFYWIVSSNFEIYVGCIDEQRKTNWKR